MKLVKIGDKVKLSLEGKLENGKIIYKKDNDNNLIVIARSYILHLKSSGKISGPNNQKE